MRAFANTLRIERTRKNQLLGCSMFHPPLSIVIVAVTGILFAFSVDLKLPCHLQGHCQGHWLGTIEALPISAKLRD
jgi:hypothetical protein